ncbi:hypothetical protein CAPTEDRAFT_187495 [Capitella teleta]|uniref:Uncharacterized protein n=1 Tax=Capitella teleta TaxID=283909 RepID=R7TUL5_CAPTE|nr:hypothetical protein CAPTEDRAFT_187495 [Capitella teleta]|eukprot:ELT95166.1 hypothetical protein CAPTEDRAFT_187495 [Capitella teleta]
MKAETRNCQVCAKLQKWQERCHSVTNSSSKSSGLSLNPRDVSDLCAVLPWNRAGVLLAWYIAKLKYDLPLNEAIEIFDPFSVLAHFLLKICVPMRQFVTTQNFFPVLTSMAHIIISECGQTEEPRKEDAVICEEFINTALSSCDDFLIENPSSSSSSSSSRGRRKRVYRPVNSPLTCLNSNLGHLREATDLHRFPIDSRLLISRSWFDKKYAGLLTYQEFTREDFYSLGQLGVREIDVENKRANKLEKIIRQEGPLKKSNLINEDNEGIEVHNHDDDGGKKTRTRRMKKVKEELLPFHQRGGGLGGSCGTDGESEKGRKRRRGDFRSFADLDNDYLFLYSGAENHPHGNRAAAAAAAFEAKNRQIDDEQRKLYHRVKRTGNFLLELHQLGLKFSRQNDGETSWLALLFWKPCLYCTLEISYELRATILELRKMATSMSRVISGPSVLSSSMTTSTTGQHPDNSKHVSVDETEDDDDDDDVEKLGRREIIKMIADGIDLFGKRVMKKMGVLYEDKEFETPFFTYAFDEVMIPQANVEGVFTTWREKFPYMDRLLGLSTRKEESHSPNDRSSFCLKEELFPHLMPHEQIIRFDVYYRWGV